MSLLLKYSLEIKGENFVLQVIFIKGMRKFHFSTQIT